jgi:acyl-CoA thioesterase-1
MLGRAINASVLIIALSMLANPLAAAAPIRVLAFGDSLTAGYGLPARDGFVPRLEAALKARGHDVQVINGGVSGDTTADGLARLDWSLAEKPDVAILELGANDGLRGLDPKLTYANLDQILTRFEQAKIPVLFTGMLAPPNFGRAYGDSFADTFKRLAERHKARFYPFFLEGVAGQPGLNQPDGLHPNKEGVTVLVEKLAPHVEDLLKTRG